MRSCVMQWLVGHTPFSATISFINKQVFLFNSDFITLTPLTCVNGNST